MPKGAEPRLCGCAHLMQECDQLEASSKKAVGECDRGPAVGGCLCWNTPCVMEEAENAGKGKGLVAPPRAACWTHALAPATGLG